MFKGMKNKTKKVLFCIRYSTRQLMGVLSKKYFNLVFKYWTFKWITEGERALAEDVCTDIRPGDRYCYL